MSGARTSRAFGWTTWLGIAILLALPALLLLDDRNWLMYGLAGTALGLPLGVSSMLLYLASCGAAITAASLALWRFVSSGGSRHHRIEAWSGSAARFRNTLILLAGLVLTAQLFPALGPASRLPICSAKEAHLVTVLAAYALAGMGHGRPQAGIGPGSTQATAKCRSAMRPSIAFVLPTWFALVLVVALAATRAAPSPPPFVPSPTPGRAPPAPAPPAAPPPATERLPAGTTTAVTTVPARVPTTHPALERHPPYRAQPTSRRHTRPEEPALLGTLRRSWQQRPVLTTIALVYGPGWLLHLLGSSLPAAIAQASAPQWLTYSQSGWPVLGLWLACCAGAAVGAGIWLRRWLND